MILRLFALIGVVAVAGTLYLILPQGVGPVAVQTTPEDSALSAYVEEGLFPEPDSLSENESIGHAVFEEPAEDEERIAAAQAEMMQSIPGMQMGGDGSMTTPEGQTTQMPEGEGMTTGETMQMPKEDEGMAMGEGETTQPAGDSGMAIGDGDTMPKDPSATAPMGAGMTPEEEHGEDEEEGMGGGGLRILADDAEVDREVEITMQEWGYSLGDLEVKPGERIRMTIRNGGEIPHEFMFMPMANMQAIRYRLERADWNLLEHEAPYERSLVLPGQSFQVTVQIETPGAWMFMCMFPYHMQLGMMGQMATPGMSMQM